MGTGGDKWSTGGTPMICARRYLYNLDTCHVIIQPASRLDCTKDLMLCPVVLDIRGYRRDWEISNMITARVAP